MGRPLTADDIRNIINAIRLDIDYSSSRNGFEILDSSNLESTDGSFYCLIARGGDVILKATTEVHAGHQFSADITLTTSSPPVFGNFKKVIIDVTSAGQLQVYPRPSIEPLTS